MDAVVVDQVSLRPEGLATFLAKRYIAEFLLLSLFIVTFIALIVLCFVNSCSFFKFFNSRWFVKRATMSFSFITAVHVVYIAVNFVNKWCESNPILLCQTTIDVSSLLKDLWLLDLSSMQIIYVLSNKHGLHLRVLYTELLELSYSFVTFISLLVLSEFDKIVVPLPDSHRILSK